MATLVIVEHTQSQLKESTLHAVTAAKQLSDEIDCLVMGYQAQAAATMATHIAGIRRVIYFDAEHFAHPLAESMAKTIKELPTDYQHILAPATTFGKNVLPRVAALLDVAQLSDVTEIIDEKTFVRPIYAGNALETVQSLDGKQLLTIRTTSFPAAKLDPNHNAPCDARKMAIQDNAVTWVNEELTVMDRPELTSARKVVSGGRALQSAENFKLIEKLADVLGAAVGASRAAVDAGYVPNDYQVGQTGKVVAPDLYIAVGISGAIQHLAGMKESKVIVAINKDADAPIFQIATYGLVGDLFKIVPELITALEK